MKLITNDNRRMKWSKSKIVAINASMTEEENFIEYVFPILRYHSRWNELVKEDFKICLIKNPYPIMAI